MKLFAMLEKSPMTLLALAGVFLILAFLLRTRKVKLTTHQATCCGLLLALTLVLSLLPLYRMPYGGTITLGGMLPIMLIAFVYGPEVGIMAGFVYGLLNLLLNPYILQPVQVLFDYPLPFMALGLCGFFPRHPYLGMAVGVAVRYLFHFIFRGGIFCQLRTGRHVPGSVFPGGQRNLPDPGSGDLPGAVPSAAHGTVPADDVK